MIYFALYFSTKNELTEELKNLTDGSSSAESDGDT